MKTLNMEQMEVVNGACMVSAKDAVCLGMGALGGIFGGVGAFVVGAGCTLLWTKVEPRDPCLF
ncbi:hypothetical protein FACS1894201_11740 [Bacteroidia bacterium]|nr:hypothetical protein FACS1894201_11740 [Bacteroidia bacterium]